MSLARLLIPALLGVLVLTTGCGSDEQQDLGECQDNSGCSGIQACVDNACVDVSCLSNQDCPLGQFCDPDTDWTCVDGC